MRPSLFLAAAVCCAPAALWGQAAGGGLSAATIEVVRTYDPSLPDAQKINLTPRIPPDTARHTPHIAYTMRTIKPLSEGYLLTSIPPAKVQREPAAAPEKLQGYLKLGLGYSLSALLDAEAGGSGAAGWSWLLYARHYGNYGDIANERAEKVPTLDLHNDIGVGVRKAFNRRTLALNAGFAPRMVHYYGFDTNVFSLQKYNALHSDTAAQQYLHTYASLDFNGINGSWNYGVGVSAHDFRAKHARTEDAVGLRIFADRRLDADTMLTLGAEAQAKGFFRSPALARQDHLHFAIAPYGTYRRNWWQAALRLGLLADKHSETKVIFLPTLNFTAAFLDGILRPYFETGGKYLDNTFEMLAAANPYISPFDTLDFRETQTYSFAVGIGGRYRSLIAYRVWADCDILTNAHFFYNTAAVASSYFNLIYDNGYRFSANAQLSAAVSPAFEVNLMYSFQQYILDSLAHPLHKPNHLFSLEARYNLWNKLVLSAGLEMRGGYYALDLRSNGGYKERPAGFILNLNAEYRFFNNSSAFLHLNNVLSSRYQYFNGYAIYGFGAMLGYALKF